jgi:undecaprenyl pyrophosphate synthase
MDMAKLKLSQLAQHGDLLDRYGASIRILGKRELVKQDVLEAVDKAEDLTRKNKRCEELVFFASPCADTCLPFLGSKSHPQCVFPVHIPR